MRMVGSLDDIRVRLRTVLPDRWFADDAPVLDGLLAGFAAGWSGLYALLGIVRRQSRLLTATDEFLDLAGRDFFGARLPRRIGEDDNAYRSRIGRTLRRDRATRAAVVDAVAEAGGTARMFEPAQPQDTGAYGGPLLAWGMAGGWGSLDMPLECLLTAQRGITAEADVAAAVAEALPAGGAAWIRFTG